MAQIQFRAKVQTVYNVDDTVAWRYIQVPTLTRKHCDMSAFRSHPKFGGLANSDLFPNILAKIRREVLGETIRLDKIRDGVTVDESGFLAVVTFDA